MLSQLGREDDHRELQEGASPPSRAFRIGLGSSMIEQSELGFRMRLASTVGHRRRFHTPMDPSARMGWPGIRFSLSHSEELAFPRVTHGPRDIESEAISSPRPR